MYRILYIDEEAEDRESFDDVMKDENIEVTALHPYADEQDMLDFVMQEKFDCIVADFRLMGKDPNVKYDGSDLLKKILSRREDFPVYILTRVRDEEDVDAIFNSTRVLQKTELEDDDDAKELKRKVIKSIDYYRHETEVLEENLNTLLEKKQAVGNLSDEEIQKLKDTDEKIERRLDTDRKVPDVIKSSDSLKTLDNILKEAEDIFKKINKE